MAVNSLYKEQKNESMTMVKRKHLACFYSNNA